VVILCDFDGTVSDPEASLAILRKFAPGRWERFEKPWLDKEISTHDCLGYQFTLLDAPVEEMAKFAADTIRLRPGFEDLVEVCKRFGHGLVISSCGVDFYIKAILEKNGLGDVPFVAIRTHWVEGLGHVAEEGLFNDQCDWCGNCKRDLVTLYRKRGAIVAYVGDGATDECAAERADIVFARAGLLDYCKEKKIKDCRPFETFMDVLRWLDDRD
jgi:2,3-diketo-5-methylthio-1-phosphopentane phosphatase